MRTTKGYADGPDGQVHYRIALPYGGDPANTSLDSYSNLVLCHQSPSSSEMFAPACDFLAAAGIRAVAIDTPGFGQSDPPTGKHSIEGYARAVRAVMEHLGIVRTAILGHHTGAEIAAEIAVTAPNLISRVILNGPPVMTTDERDAFRKALDDAPRIEPAADGMHLVDLWNKRAKFTPGWTDLTAMHTGVIQMLVAGESELDGFIAAFAYDVGITIGQISQPCLILTNTGDDIYYAVQRAKKLRPDFSYFELSGGTHDIVSEQPEAWAGVVAEFVLAAD